MESLKFSVADWCFIRDENPVDYYARLRSAAFDAAETVPPARFAAARKAGVRILNTDAPGKADGVNRLENHARLLPQIAGTIRLAAVNGVPHVIVFSGERKGQAPGEGLENCVKAFKSLCPEAEKLGVVMALELINSIDQPDYLADSSAFGFELTRRVSSPAFRLLYDAYHMQVMGEDVAGDIERNAGFIAHIHVSQVPGMVSPLLPGPADFRAIVSRAHAAGYRGHWGLEFRAAGDTVEELCKARNLLNSYIQL